MRGPDHPAGLVLDPVEWEWPEREEFLAKDLSPEEESLAKREEFLAKASDWAVVYWYRQFGQCS
ncbi:hypothetical protein [Sphingorhabdus sp.]|jgi:hypothetical protein|uniref:hypothetical protein n=1 Tax=Sphingorhabdus sp. TaxID=1902408 RepID=UPI003BAFC0C2|nr:hypothetical protein [Sphingomonadales bacterium]MBK9432275.1 hypothetical protein [Sphingomonadales bacterium]MBL0022188.1 hypothetical protein [Sphingomonadales bacterium]